MSQSEYIRQAIFYSRITPTIRVSSVNEELLSAIGSLTAEYGKIGGNLNQLARYMNEGGGFTKDSLAAIRGAAADLTALKFEVLQKVGEAVGNDKTYQL